MSGKCLTVTDAKKDIGTRITMHSCQSGSASQIVIFTVPKASFKCSKCINYIFALSFWQWKYDSASKTFVSVLSNLCLDAGGTYTCQDEPIKAMAFCNWTLPVHERVKDLVSRMVSAPNLRYQRFLFLSLLFSLLINVIYRQRKNYTARWAIQPHLYHVLLYRPMSGYVCSNFLPS